MTEAGNRPPTGLGPLRGRRGQRPKAPPARWTREAWDEATSWPDSLNELRTLARPPMPPEVEARLEAEYERAMRPVHALEAAYERQTGESAEGLAWEYADWSTVWEDMHRAGLLARIGIEIVGDGIEEGAPGEYFVRVRYD